MQHGLIPQALLVRGLRLLKKRFHFSVRENLGQLMLALPCRQRSGRVFGNQTAVLQETVKTLPGSDIPGGRSIGLPRFVQILQIILQICFRKFGQSPAFKIRFQLTKIPHIGTECILSGVFILNQILLKQIQIVFRMRHVIPSFKLASINSRDAVTIYYKSVCFSSLFCRVWVVM